MQVFKNLLSKKITIREWQLDLYATGYIFAGIFLGVLIVTAGLIPNIFAAITTNLTKDSDTDFSQGTLSTTEVIGSGAGAYVQIAGAGTGAAWLDLDYTYRKSISFNSADITENLTDFPVYINLTGSNFDFADVQADGDDIRFTDSDGTTLLAYEVERWEPGSSRASLWVKVPQIDQASTTDNIYLYYSNPSATSGQDAENVWTNSYHSVWHLRETPAGTSSAFFDSTANDYDLGGTTNLAANDHVEGQIGYGVNVDNGTQDYMGMLSPSIPLANSNYSVSMWIRPENAASGFFEHGGVFDDHTDFVIQTNLNNNMSTDFSEGASLVTPTSSAPLNSWSYINVSLNDTANPNVRNFYVNGALQASDNPNPYVGTGFLTVGAAPARGGYVRGDIDEVRVSSVVRSAEWVEADYLSVSNTFTTHGDEETSLPSSGTWESPTNANVIDLGWNLDWGDGTAGSTAFSASVANVDSNANIAFQMRVATTAGGLSSATYQTLGVANSGVTFTQTKAQLDALGLSTGANRYVQVRATLNNSDGVTNPRLNSFTITYQADDTPPSTNADNIQMLKNVGGSIVASNGWANNLAPYFSWDAASEADSSLLGYCLYLGTDAGGDPAAAKGLLGTSPVTIPQSSTCQFIIGTNTIDFATTSYRGDPWLTTSDSPYYIAIKAIDVLGNEFPTSEQFQFRFDNAVPNNPTYFSLPSGFIASKDVTITWPTAGADAADDSNSGVAGLQYRIGSGGTWYGDTHNGNQDLTDLLVDDGAYTMDPTTDYPNLNDGTNLIFMRTWDVAGNATTSLLSGVLLINTVAPSTPQNLQVTPVDNTTNSYAFDWDEPDTFIGSAANITYCYSVNILPGPASCNYTQGGITSLTADAYATQPGDNIMYVVARDEALNINYATAANVIFTYSGSAPGIPQNLDVADISIKETSNWRLSLSWESPTNVGAGVASYRILRGTTNTSCTENLGAFTQVGTVNSPFYADTGLTQQTYFYCIRACDSANSCSATSVTDSGFPDGKFTEPATLVDGPNVENITSRTATIVWSTDRGSDSKVSFGLTSNNYFVEEPSKSAQVTGHSITLNSLNPGTRYFYRAKWTDEDGNTGTSEEREFVTAPSPVVKDVQVLQIGLSSALLRFTISNASRAKIYYGKSTGFGGLNEIETSRAESTYNTLIENLEDGTKYFYRIAPVDSDGFEYASTVLDLTTLPRPRISNITVEEQDNTAQPTVLVNWLSNTAISSIVTYYPVSNPERTLDAVNVELVDGEHAMEIKSLQPNTRYALIVRGVDKQGNEAVSDVQNFTTDTDNRPPKILNLKIEGTITNVTEGINSGNQRAQLIVTWDTDEAASSQVEFGQGTTGVYTQKTQEESNLKQNHLVVISNLTPSQVYNLRVISKDEADNESLSSDNVTITPKTTSSVIELVANNLLQIFGFLR